MGGVTKRGTRLNELIPRRTIFINISGDRSLLFQYELCRLISLSIFFMVVALCNFESVQPRLNERWAVSELINGRNDLSV